MISWDDIYSVGKKTSNFLGSDSGQGLLKGVGLGLSAYGAYNQNKAMNKQNSLIAEQNALSRDAYKYNKSLSDRDLAKENMSQSNFTEGFSSVFGDSKKKKKKKLDSYSGFNNFSG